MWNIPSKERLARIPRLYETEQSPLKDKLIHLHCFIGGCDWYLAEFDGEDLFWGFAHLGDDHCAEWGYISFNELKSIKIDGWLEIDCETEEIWQVKRAIEIEKIRIAQGWPADEPLALRKQEPQPASGESPTWSPTRKESLP
jgi:hypothetical protein